MIPLIIAAALVPAAVLAAIVLEPHMESYATRKRLRSAHRASHGSLNTVQPTSSNISPETQPHQPRVQTSKSPVPKETIES